MIRSRDPGGYGIDRGADVRGILGCHVQHVAAHLAGACERNVALCSVDRDVACAGRNVANTGQIAGYKGDRDVTIARRDVRCPHDEVIRLGDCERLPGPVDRCIERGHIGDKRRIEL